MNFGKDKFSTKKFGLWINEVYAMTTLAGELGTSDLFNVYVRESSLEASSYGQGNVPNWVTI